MIRKEDIRDRAGEWQLRMDVVEKDYILGWLLMAIGRHAETASTWVFKGGTCLKKCFFETYRFSEDLDFSLLPSAAYAEGELRRILGEVTELAAELSGVTFPAETIAINVRRNLQGDPTYEARIGYRGPLGIPTVPRVRIDLTRSEPVLEPPTQRPVFHAYPDALSDDVAIATYSLEELFAEKMRALIERTRPRDLYDVVFIMENIREGIDLERSRELLRRKCAVKTLKVPSSDALVELIRASDELHSEWKNMLGHQLPELPPIEGYLDRLPGLLGWIDAVVVPVGSLLASAPSRPDESLVASPGLRYWGTGVPVEAIRFAGGNRLLVQFAYHGRRRSVEPYSLRRSRKGKLLMYGWERESEQIKAYNTAEMGEVRVTKVPFVPRYAIELSSSAPIHIRPTALPVRRSTSLSSRRARPSRQGQRSKTGLAYVVECPICGRRFRRVKMDLTLREHKDRNGYRCMGRHGLLVETRYE